MNLNRDQREGIAKVSGNLATASMVAAIVGGAVDHKIGWDWTGNAGQSHLLTGYEAE